MFGAVVGDRGSCYLQFMKFSRFLLLQLVLVVVVGVGCDPGEPRGEGVGNTPADGLAVMRREKIDEFRPEGVTFTGIVESQPIGDVDPYHVEYWGFEAADTTVEAEAANAILVEARKQGWAGPDFAGPGMEGVAATTLKKGRMELSISYVTEDYFPAWNYDEDILSIECNLTVPARDTGE